VPLTHVVNYIDNSLRVGKQKAGLVTSGLAEVSELESAISSPPSEAIPKAARRFPGSRAQSRHRRSRHGLRRSRCSQRRQPGGQAWHGHMRHWSSGSGKSTLLRCLNRLVEPKAGDVLLDGASILANEAEKLRRRVGMVFQQFNLFPDHTALENVMLSLTKVKGIPVQEAERIAAARLADVGFAAANTIVPAVFPVASSSVWQSPCARNGRGGYPVRTR